MALDPLRQGMCSPVSLVHTAPVPAGLILDPFSRMGSAKQGRACGIRSSLGMRTKLRHEGWGGGGAHTEPSLCGVEEDRPQLGSSWCSCLASGAQPWLRLSLPSPGIPDYILDSNRRGLGEDRCVRVSVCLCGYDKVAEAGLCLKSGS